MNNEKAKLILNYFHRVKSANKELPKKEAFKDLLNRLYHGDKEIERVIDKISLGSETTILDIPRKDKMHKGSADTLYNKIIIEFENDLKITLNHAKEQLAGYLLGQFNAGEGYNFTLIASDCITWKVYAPDISCLEKINELNEDELILNEIKSASFTLTEKNTEDFYYWIDRFLFKEEKQRATLKRIEEAFGYQSIVFIECFREMNNHFKAAKKYGEVQVSFEQWSKFLSIAYGSYEASENNFIIHTYLSVFAKMLAYAVVSNDAYIDDAEMKAIIDGTIFHKYSIRNFVDDDFYHWVKSDRNFKALKKVFRLIAQEITTFNFQEVDEDILKGVYQELIDLDTRHALGEYYTPDWLCQRVLQEFDLKEGKRVLDPACGSGSFLIAAVHRFRELNPNIPVEEINASIYGIDIHPLSVQIAKTNMLLALGKDVVNARTPVHINVILANTLLAPDGVDDLFGNQFKMQIDKDTLELSSKILNDVKIFDEALELAEELAEQTYNKKKATEEVFETILRQQVKGGFDKQVIESFYKIYGSLRTVKEKGRDSIWKFIVQNLYKPYFLSKSFDFVIGNPPWFTFKAIKNEEYQNILVALANQYEVKPVKTANMPQMEIAAIFLAYCTNYFLKETGKLAFVLPRSFFSADSHDNTRSGKVLGMRLINIWDMDNIEPLFRVPSGVFFTEKTEDKRNIPAKGLNGIVFSGKLPFHNCNYKIAKDSIVEEAKTWYYVKQGSSSALSIRKYKNQSIENPYKELFKNGAAIYPRPFFFVELAQEKPIDWKDRIVNVKTAESIKPDSKEPWKGIELSGRIESKFLFRTAIAKSVLPFLLFEPDLTLLPIEVRVVDGRKHIELNNSDELQKKGYLLTSKWFRDSENIWKIKSTEKNRRIALEDYLNWQHKLTNQNLNTHYLVVYNSTGTNANAVIIDRNDIEFEFIADIKTFALYTNNRDEAYYVSAILNSKSPNELMKDFQSRGLFGARDVHKKILDIYFPKFNEEEETHIRLAELSKAAHGKAAQYIKDNPPQKELTSIHLGRLRVEIKKHLSAEMKEIDKIVKKLVG
jgi:type I restriction-modification system DNA methylase subunit